MRSLCEIKHKSSLITICGLSSSYMVMSEVDILTGFVAMSGPGLGSSTIAQVLKYFKYS